MRPEYESNWLSGTGEKSFHLSQSCSMICANELISSRLTIHTRSQQKANKVAAQAANSNRTSIRAFLSTVRFMFALSHSSTLQHPADALQESGSQLSRARQQPRLV